MKTLLVTGSDTGVGKTWVAGILARRFAAAGRATQIVKPVEAGVGPEERGDACLAAAVCGAGRVSAYTLKSFRLPIAPVDAARAQGERLRLSELVSLVKALPQADIRIVEGAGGVAVPVDESGSDWADFAVSLGVDYVVLVTEFRLGVINQARLSYAYARSRGLVCGIWLNEIHPVEWVVRASSKRSLEACSVPLWGESQRDCLEGALGLELRSLS